ncbi:cupin domain-containing protein [Janthinobacterium agaricidamnosum]|uniref:Putative signal peptide protein n=1 Tax=Janthinobacterium agaricidamnosum NBRC 102515 = DSM 9628 TaxID=1349767 RepID=W0VE37_9BURK|nr:cupin domain-containing protein [Janthinobacterium agaricidamnosum]CDG85577.1 putative signal peptide protein [Janthinobacterium agaricidamnosum NBRC 102515 = DSM 9628]
MNMLLTSALLALGIAGGACAQGLPATASGEILAENVQWKAFPAFPPEARLAVLIGDPSRPGPYVVRVKVPANLKLMPHTHPEDRIYTVMSGVFYIGYGTTFDADKLKAYAPGSVIVLPANTPHFHWARSGEYITQVSGSGPLGIQYVRPQDDPRNVRNPQYLHDD